MGQPASTAVSGMGQLRIAAESGDCTAQSFVAHRDRTMGKRARLVEETHAAGLQLLAARADRPRFRHGVSTGVVSKANAAARGIRWQVHERHARGRRAHLF